jgi:ethanolamine utilization microcompartment shell protein EutL
VAGLNLLYFDSDGFQQFHRILHAVVFAVENFFDVAQIDEALGAHHARQVSDENIFLNGPWSVAIDDGVFFRVQAAAVARFFTVAAVMKPAGVAVVAYSQDFAKIGARDDRANLKAMTSRSLSQCAREAQIDVFKTRSLAFRFHLGLD